MRIICSIISLLIVFSVTAQDMSQYEKHQFVDGDDTLLYRLLYPTKYDINKQYPLVLFLHGAGERGNDNEKQLVHGAKLFADSLTRAKFPAFVVFPQCPQDDFWAGMRMREDNADSLGRFAVVSREEAGTALSLAEKLVDSLAATPQVNKRQVYLGGLSMGGMGTFELLWRKPGFFAAAFPICGAGDPAKVTAYARRYPIWVFHGAADNVVPVSNSRLMVDALKKAGARLQYTEYPGVGHDSWTNAFAEPGLLPWLFKQKRR